MRAFSVLPYAAIASAYGLLVLVARDDWGTPVGDLIIGAVCLTGLVVARQVAALRENARLLFKLAGSLPQSAKEQTMTSIAAEETHELRVATGRS